MKSLEQIREIMDSYDFPLESELVIRQQTLEFSKGAVASMCWEDGDFPYTEYVHMQVNLKEKRIWVTPANKGSKESIRWCDESGNPQQVECKGFSSFIYNRMGWDPQKCYRIPEHVRPEGGPMWLFFDLAKADPFMDGEEDRRESGGRKENAKEQEPGQEPAAFEECEAPDENGEGVSR